MLAIECTGVQFTFFRAAAPAAEETPLELLCTDPTESVCRFTCDTLRALTCYNRVRGVRLLFTNLTMSAGLLAGAEVRLLAVRLITTVRRLGPGSGREWTLPEADAAAAAVAAAFVDVVVGTVCAAGEPARS